MASWPVKGRSDVLILPLSLVCSFREGTQSWKMSFWRPLRFQTISHVVTTYLRQKFPEGDKSKAGKAKFLDACLEVHHPSSVSTWVSPCTCSESMKSRREKNYLHPARYSTLFTLDWFSWGFGLWLLLSVWRLYGDAGCVLENWLHSSTCLAILRHFPFLFYFPFLLIALNFLFYLDVLCSLVAGWYFIHCLLSSIWTVFSPK